MGRGGGGGNDLKMIRTCFFLMLQKYVRVVRQSSCNIGCGEHRRFLSVCPSENVRLLEDDAHFKWGKDWAAEAEADTDDTVSRWPQVSQITRT
jgi:hypothetical protein